ncbi:hypothetical protein [Streptomyces sp. NPDC056323]|uniref:hypothetical protein n=1 Tax=unclassified Streptomyces TaxID=2593676 RepID=UPI0035D84F9E
MTVKAPRAPVRTELRPPDEMVSAPTWSGTGPRYAEPAWSREAGKSWVNDLVALDPG